MIINLNFERLKFWKKKPSNQADLQENLRKLIAINQLKDEAYLLKNQEFENFKRSSYATLAAIALAHGGTYYLQNEFTETVTSGEFGGRLSIEADDNGLTIAIKTEDSSEVKEGE